MELTDLLSVILKIKHSKPTRVELNFIIEKSYQISISFLKSKFANNLHFLGGDNQTLEDIAMDAIVPLFVKNNFGQLGISRSLDKWKDDLNTLSDAEYFLSKIIWRRVDQTVTKVFKERDPIFGKILKTLNVCIKNNRYKKVRYFGSVLVLPNSEAILDGLIVDNEEFNHIPEHYFGLKQTELFNKLFEFLVSDTIFCAAIPLNPLVKRIKHFYSNRLAVKLDNESFSTDIISLNEIVSDSLNGIKQKLETYYIPNNKLNPSEADLIYASFDDISKDMLNGIIDNSLYTYLHKNNVSITREIFYSKYHNIMSYLFVTFKKSIANDFYT